MNSDTSSHIWSWPVQGGWADLYFDPQQKTYFATVPDGESRIKLAEDTISGLEFVRCPKKDRESRLNTTYALLNLDSVLGRLTIYQAVLGGGRDKKSNKGKEDSQTTNKPKARAHTDKPRKKTRTKKIATPVSQIGFEFSHSNRIAPKMHESNLNADLIHDCSLGFSEVSYAVKKGFFYEDYHELLRELYALTDETLLPLTYQINVLRPFIKCLIGLGKEGFDALFHNNQPLSSNQEIDKTRIRQTSEAIIQRNHGKYALSSFNSLTAIQNLVDSFYSYLHYHISHSFTKTKISIVPPLVKWGDKAPVTATPFRSSMFLERSTWWLDDAFHNILPGFVNFPAEVKHEGLFAWTALAHELAGHYTLGANSLIIPQLRNAVKSVLTAELLENECIQQGIFKVRLIEYWELCLEEIASDLLGVLTLGPAFAIGFTGYMKASFNLNAPQPLYGGDHKGLNYLSLHTKDHPFFLAIKGLNDSIYTNKTKGDVGNTNSAEIKSDFLESVIAATQSEMTSLEKEQLEPFLNRIKANSNLSEFTYDRIRLPTDHHPHHLFRLLAIRKYVGSHYSDFIETKSILEQIDHVVTHALGNGNTLAFRDAETGDKTHQIRLVPIHITKQFAERCVEEVVKAILTTKLDCLSQKSLGDIFQWTADDQKQAATIQQCIEQDQIDIKKVYAAGDHRHILAAAILASMKPGAKIGDIFETMKSLLNNEIGGNNNDASQCANIVEVRQSSPEPIAHYFVESTEPNEDMIEFKNCNYKNGCIKFYQNKKGSYVEAQVILGSASWLLDDSQIFVESASLDQKLEALKNKSMPTLRLYETPKQLTFFDPEEIITYISDIDKTYEVEIMLDHQSQSAIRLTLFYKRNPPE